MTTLNPIEMEGTFPLPMVELNRFTLRLSLGYPNQADELAILKRFRSDTVSESLSISLFPADILDAQSAVGSIRISDLVIRYLLAVIARTRAHTDIRLSSSPRASLTLQCAAQAKRQ